MCGDSANENPSGHGRCCINSAHLFRFSRRRRWSLIEFDLQVDLGFNRDLAIQKNGIRRRVPSTDLMLRLLSNEIRGWRPSAEFTLLSNEIRGQCHSTKLSLEPRAQQYSQGSPGDLPLTSSHQTAELAPLSLPRSPSVS